MAFRLIAPKNTPKKSVNNFEKCCKLCLKQFEISKSGQILKTKRRDLTSAASSGLLNNLTAIVPELQTERGKSFLCLECVNRLNRYDLTLSKLKQLRLEEDEARKEIVTIYSKQLESRRFKRGLPVSPAKEPQRVSPSKIPVRVDKENVVPTDNRMFSTRNTSGISPSKIPLRQVENATSKARRPLRLSTDKPRHNAQITYNFPSQTKTRVLDGFPTYMRVGRAMLDNNPKQLASAVWDDPILRNELEGCLSTEIRKECQHLCRTTTNSLLQKVSPTELLSFSFKDLLEQWEKESPLLVKVLSATVSNTNIIPDRHQSNVAFAGSMLLRCRNPKMSAAAHNVGLLLDYGGAHDGTIQKMCSLGVSVSPRTVYDKKKEISNLHDQNLNARFADYKKTLIDIETSEDTLKHLDAVQLYPTSLAQSETQPRMSTSTDVQAEILGSQPTFMETDSNLSGMTSQPDIPQQVTSDNITAVTPPSALVTASINSTASSSLSHPVYSNPFLGSFSNASLATDVADINSICENTKKVDVTAGSDMYMLKHHTIYQHNVASDSILDSEATSDKTAAYHKTFVKTSKEKLKDKACRTEVYGDNCDLRVNASHQTKESRSKDYHWFVALAADLRVEGEGMSTTRPRQSVTKIQNSEFLPSTDDNAELTNAFEHHIMRTITKHLDKFEAFKHVVPDYISHPHIKEYKSKSTYTLIDLYDKNESRNEDMIDILVDLQEKCIPHVQGKPAVIERKVFGGDVLTNERAYQAQLDMANGESEHEKLLGFIHRPEGLHRLMNLLKYIYETFYLTSSVNEQGTMYQLKCLLDRRDVKTDMTAAYRQCKNFFDDVLDGHILSAACHFFGMNKPEDTPTKNKIPLFLTHASKEEQLEWLSNACRSILDIYVLEASRAIPDLFEDTSYMQAQMETLVGEDQKFNCPHLDCAKSYKQFHWLKRHMKEKHSTDLNICPPQHSKTKHSAEYDGVFNVASAFMKVGLLFRDTDDAYRMGDGNRLMRNAKFEMLHFHQGHHIKYRLWLWRMLAYEKAILSEKEAYEYKWNMSFNFGRGLGHLIPNDNLVEINVHMLKEQARRMGSNVAYQNCRDWVKCFDFLSKLSEEFDRIASVPTKSGKHAAAKRKLELEHIVHELNTNEVFQFIPGREHPTFTNFSSDLLSSVNAVELNDWLNKNKKRAEKEMQID